MIEDIKTVVNKIKIITDLLIRFIFMIFILAFIIAGIDGFCKGFTKGYYCAPMVTDYTYLGKEYICN
jgi:hypothetical protein